MYLSYDVSTNVSVQQLPFYDEKKMPIYVNSCLGHLEAVFFLLQRCDNKGICFITRKSHNFASCC